MGNASPEHYGKLLLETSSRVAIVDTDASGLIYYGAVYRWAEAVFSMWWADIGHPIGAAIKSGWATPCVHSEAEYRAPLMADDVLRFRLHTGHVGRTSFGFDVPVYRGDDPEPSVVARTRNVFGRMQVKGDPHSGFKPEELPDWLIAALT